MSLVNDNPRGFLEGGFTCAVYYGEEVYQSKERGVAPLLAWLKSGRNFQGFLAVDKVVGKAAAFLYVRLGVKKVYAIVLSEGAEEVFRRFGIDYESEEKVPMIRNRLGDGYCPMEQAVWTTDEPIEAQRRIEQTLQRLKEQK